MQVSVSLRFPRLDDPAGQALAGIACRLGAIVVRVLMDDDRFPDDVSHLEPIREKAHAGVSIVGEQHGKIARVIAVGLIRRIPMFSRPLEWVLRIADFASGSIMYMEAMGPDWLPAR